MSPKRPEQDSLHLKRRTVEATDRHEREIEDGLTAIFRDDAGTMPDLKTFEQKRSRWWMYALGAVSLFIIALVAAAWMGFSLFKPFRGFSGQGLAVVIEGPERISLGQETTYFVNYQNRTSEPMTAAELKISFPSDFIISGMEPEPGQGMVWNLGGLPIDGRGTIKVRGTFTGALGTATAIQVVGTYQGLNPNDDHDALATKLLNYSDSVLVGTLGTPSKVLPGDQVILRYRLENRGNDVYADLRARITLPEGFQLSPSSTFSATNGAVEIPLGSMAAGASSTVSVEGTFASGASGEAHVIAEAGRPSADGTFLSSQRTETSFTVLAGDLALKTVVNGQDGNVNVAYGSTLRFAIGYENTATENLEDIQVRFRFEIVSPTGTKSQVLVNWDSLNESASATQSGDELSWNKNGLPALERLPSREQGTINFSIGALPAASGTEALVIRAIAEAEVKTVGSTEVNRIVHAAPITLTYLTDTEISSQARYFSEEGAPLGAGPLPPEVGKETTYRIEWNVTKRFHELGNLKLKATLPSVARWTGKVVDDAGQITYDEKTRIVTWTLNRMPADIHDQTIAFDVAVTPGEADADRFVKILGEARFEATDAMTGETVVRTQPALTSDLENDENASGKGVVRTP
jgi:hypothetical protein